MPYFFATNNMNKGDESSVILSRGTKVSAITLTLPVNGKYFLENFKKYNNCNFTEQSNIPCGKYTYLLSRIVNDMLYKNLREVKINGIQNHIRLPPASKIVNKN